MLLCNVEMESFNPHADKPTCSSPKVAANRLGDGEDYLSSLRTLKRTFLEGNEGNILSDAIRTCFGPGVLSFLDVGCGDGLFIRRAKDLLHLTGADLSITAIDPLPAAVRNTVRHLPADTVCCARFEDFSPEARFDVINVRHSLYYLSNPAHQVGRMIDLLKPGGLLTFTLWGQDCDLYCAYGATRTQFPDDDPYPMTAEELVPLLKGSSSLRDVRCNLSTGKIDLSAWRSSEDVLRSAYVVLCRQLHPLVRDRDLELFRCELERLRLTGQRVIAFITCRKVF